MRSSFSTFLVTIFAILLVLQPLPTNALTPDISKVGVSTGDTFTYVLEKFTSDGTGDFEPVSAYINGTTEPLTVYEGSEWNMTIVNDTIRLGDQYYFIEAEFSNGTHIVRDNIDLNAAPFGNFVVFPDWTYWEASVADFVAEFPLGSDYGVENGEDEFIFVMMTSEATVDGETLYFESRYNKTTGVQNYIHISVSMDNILLELRFSVKNYVYIPHNLTLTPITVTSTYDKTTESWSTITVTDGSTSKTTVSSESSKSSNGTPSIELDGFTFLVSFGSLITIFFTLQRLKTKKY